jgi:hypothetical protein
MSYEDTIHRGFYDRFEELAPQEWFEIGLFGAGLNENYITAPATPSNVLSQSTVFSGVPYSFESPADDSTSPVQLGVLPGDKLFLIGVAGGANNHRLFFITSVTATTLVVAETLNAEAGLTAYEFKILRRLA